MNMQPCKHGIFSHRVCETCKETAQLESELTALREKNAELERQLESVRDMRTRAYTTRDAMTDKYLAEKERADRLQHLLDEAAKQDKQSPFTWIRMRNGEPDWSEDCFGDEDNLLCEFTEEDIAENGYTVEPLYRLPPNLPALVEQAEDKFANELLHILKTVHCVDTSNWDGDEGLVPTMAKCISQTIEQAKAEEREVVARWLNALAESNMASARGGLGDVFAVAKASALTKAAQILTASPDVLDHHREARSGK